MTLQLHEDASSQNGQPGEEQYGRYRAMSAMAVSSLAFGVLSALTVWWHWALGLIPAGGILLGYLALVRIRETPDELTGRGLALAGLILSGAFGVLGYGAQLSARAKEFPYGYERITYEMLQPDPSVPGERIPSEAYQRQYDSLRNNKVGLKGYMYPGRQPTHLKTFLLCPAIPNCPFCAPNPKPTDIIRVKLEGDLRARYTTHLVRVGGKFHVNAAAPGGVPYEIEADYFVQP